MANFKALVVGIDDYPPPNQLPSCVNDANAMIGLLRSAGFEAECLLNSQATVAAVTEKLKQLFHDVKQDDRLVFFYSGHGYTERKDGLMEEYLVLIDGLFQDDLLSELTQAVAPGVLTVILDSCFSGGMEKMLFFKEGLDTRIEVAKVKAWQPTPEDLRRKGGIAPADVVKSKGKSFTEPVELRKFGLSPAATKQLITRTLDQTPASESFAKSYGASKGPGSDEVGQTQTRGLLVSACLETETAAASTSTTDGKSAFTYALLDSVRAMGINQSTTSIFQHARDTLTSLHFRQTPLVIAPMSLPNLPAFSFLSLKPMAGAASPATVAGMTQNPTFDPAIVGTLLAALLPALIEVQAKTVAWPPIPFDSHWRTSGNAMTPQKNFQDALSTVLIAVTRAVLQTVSERPR